MTISNPNLPLIECFDCFDPQFAYRKVFNMDSVGCSCRKGST